MRVLTNKLRPIFAAFIFVFFLGSCSQKPNSDIQTQSSYNNADLKSGSLQYRVSSSWQKTNPTNPLRLEEYVIDPISQTKLAVHYFPGMTGNIEENLLRWKNQFRADEEFKEIEKTQFNENGLPITLYHLAGTLLEASDPMDPNSPKTARDGFAMIALAVELKDGTWFFKAYGPESVIDSQRPRFDELIKTFSLEN